MTCSRRRAMPRLLIGLLLVLCAVFTLHAGEPAWSDTVSTCASGTSRAVGATNGTFFDSAGPSSFFKSDGVIMGYTKPRVHDQQAIVETLGGVNGTAGISVIPRPGAGWPSLSAPNIISAGPDLINNGSERPVATAGSSPTALRSTAAWAAPA